LIRIKISSFSMDQFWSAFLDRREIARNILLQHILAAMTGHDFFDLGQGNPDAVQGKVSAILMH